MVLPGSLHVRIAVVFLLLWCTAAVSNAAVFVDCDAPSGGDGTSWATALQHVQEGLNAATTSNNEVWVAEGTYTQNVLLRPWMGLYGGFDGTETTRSQRNPAGNLTIIDGGQAGNTVIGANGAVIDGFTITNGKPVSSGGGVYCSYSSPTISNCKITLNVGNGIYCTNSSPTIIGCEITENTDKGVYCYIGGNASITDCLIARNAAVQYAGIYANSATPSIRRCIVTGNHTTGTDARGGGIAFVSCPSGVTVENCLIEGNTASMGGGVFCNMSSPSFMNCTIVGNSAVTTGGNLYLTTSSPSFTNTIVAYGVAPLGSEAYKNTPANPTFAYCDFWDNGTEPYDPASWIPSSTPSNIVQDPLFVDLALGDYHLMPASFCIDTGTDVSAPAEDLEGNPRPGGARTDIGAYEIPDPTVCDDIVDAKLESDGTIITISDVIISGRYNGFFYVEESDRTAGIRVLWPQLVPADKTVTITGTLESRSGIERQIRASSVTIGEQATVEPIGMGNRSLIGSDMEFNPGPPVSGQMGQRGTGANNVGLLIRTWGSVSSPTTSGFVLDDGSGRCPTVVLEPGVTLPQEGDLVQVTGISSIQGTPNDLLPIILAHGSFDVIPLN